MDITRLERVKSQLPGAHIYQGVVLESCFPAHLVDQARHFEFDPQDILVTTYPKSGTTWTLEITWLLLNKCDMTKAKSTRLMDRIFTLGYDYKDPNAIAPTLQPPRVLKSHMPEFMLHDGLEKYKPRVIVVMRNPKDALVSKYNFYRMDKCLGPFRGTWDEFFEMYKKDDLTFSFWEEHIKGYWAKRDQPNYHFIKFEDMKRKPKEVIAGMAKFLNVSLSESELEAVVKHTSFNKMKENSMVNRKDETSRFDMSTTTFFRKGQIGDWKNYFSQEQSEYFDEILKELETLGLKFDMD